MVKHVTHSAIVIYFQCHSRVGKILCNNKCVYFCFEAPPQLYVFNTLNVNRYKTIIYYLCYVYICIYTYVCTMYTKNPFRP